ncbi:MAG: hypothetical protein KDC93_18195 [Cyclobacteriaceae bacterium]|nr:hypothetical protein [Cyclobacteriaceae bacterium]
MLLAPKKARAILRKAGSTPFINYAEITLRLIPAISLIVYADYSKFPLHCFYFGSFMLLTSIVLYFIPVAKHHGFSLRAADILKPLYLQLISPFSMLFGWLVIYMVI